MSISYEGIGAWCATFVAGTGAEEGKVVKVSANGTVSKVRRERRLLRRGGGDGPRRQGDAACSSAALCAYRPAAGDRAGGRWNLLAADGNGGVSVVTSSGHSYLLPSRSIRPARP